MVRRRDRHPTLWGELDVLVWLAIGWGEAPDSADWRVHGTEHVGAAPATGGGLWDPATLFVAHDACQLAKDFAIPDDVITLACGS